MYLQSELLRKTIIYLKGFKYEDVTITKSTKLKHHR